VLIERIQMDAVEPVIEQPKPRQGPQAGYRKKYSRESVAKLEKLGCDPIAELVELHKKFVKEITRQEDLQAKKDAGLSALTKDGKTVGYSAMAHSNLLAADQKLLNDLVPYRYAKIPVEVAIQDNALPPIMIELTADGDVYEIDPSENVDVSEDIPMGLALKGDDE
jgi:hypothetical protein